MNASVLSHIQHDSLLFINLLTIRVLVYDLGVIIADLYATALEGAYLVVTSPCASFRAHVDLTTLGHIRILLTHIFFYMIYVGEPLVAFRYFTVVPTVY